MVEERMVKKFFSSDGVEHPNREEAEAHEEANFDRALVGLTLEQVRAAIERKPEAIGIADALEKAGAAIARARRAAGQFRRNVPPRGASAEPPTAAEGRAASPDEDDEQTEEAA